MERKEDGGTGRDLTLINIVSRNENQQIRHHFEGTSVRTNFWWDANSRFQEEISDLQASAILEYFVTFILGCL